MIILMIRDDTVDDNGVMIMGSKEYERVKRWREKNRALVNIKQREYRRKRLGGSKQSSDAGGGHAADGNAIQTPLPAQSSKQETLSKLRDMLEHADPPHSPVHPVKPKFINGMAVSEAQWERHVEKLEEAKKKGFVIDEYSQ